MSQFYWGLIIFLILIGFGIYILSRGQKQLVKQLDGRLTELLVVTKSLARSEGVTAGRAEVEAERDKKEKDARDHE
jgi:hypothetical protein